MVNEENHSDPPRSDVPTVAGQLIAPQRFEYDAFLSYRRRDATRLAQWMRSKLQHFRLPPEILRELSHDKQELHRRGPRVWLDSSYEKSSDDFLLKKIFPALDRSARLIVICTPAALERILERDGTVQDNWLVREVDRFLSISRAEELDRPIDVVFGPGAVEGSYPGRLSERPRWDWIDFRTFAAWRARWFSEALDGAVAKLVASLYDIPDRFLPDLRREERLRRNRTIAGFAIGGLSIAALTTGLAIWGVVERANAVAALRNVRITQAQMSVRLATEELQKKDPARSLATALAGVETPDMADTDKKVIPESITATGISLVSQVFVATLQDHTDAVLRVSLGAGASSAVTVAADGRAISWSKSENSAFRPTASTTLAGGIFSIAEHSGLIASGSPDGYIKFWNPARPDLIFEPFNLGERVRALAFGDDGQSIAALGEDGKLAVWNFMKGSISWTPADRVSGGGTVTLGSSCGCLVVGTTSGDLFVWSLDRKDPLVVHGSSGQMLKGVFGQDGQFLFVTDDSRVWLTSAPTWQTPLNIGQHDRLVTALVVSMNQRWAATTSMDGTAWVWDLRKRQPWKRIRLGGAGLSSASLSPDGDRIALGSGDGAVAVWDVGDANSEPSEVYAMRGHTGAVLDLVFTADGMWLASASSDLTVRIWQCRPPRRPSVAQAHQATTFHAVSNNGRYLVSGGADKKIQIWIGAEWSPGKSIYLEDQPTALAISDDGRNVFIGTDRGDLLGWSTPTAIQTPIFHDLGVVGSVVISPDQKMLAAIGVQGNPLLCKIGPQPECEVVALGGWGYSVAFSEDGHWMGAASGVEKEIGHALILDLNTKKTTFLKGHTDRVGRIQFDPNATRVITASWDGTSRIWSISSGKEVVRLVEPIGRIATAGFSPDGKWVATSSNEKTLRLWEIPDPNISTPTIVLETNKSVLVSDKLPVAQIQFGLGGSLLAGSSPNGDVYLWHVPDGTLRAILDAGEPTQNMQFHPGGLQLTATTHAGRLLSWKMLPELAFNDESLLGFARGVVPTSGALMGMTGQPATALPNVSEVCPLLRGHNVGLPPQNLSGAARARQHVSIPAACYLRSERVEGSTYLEGLVAEVAGDPATAKAGFLAAVAQGQFAADIGLGDLSFLDSLSGMDFDNARIHYSRALDHKIPRAASRLGWLLLAGGASNNINRAKQYFEDGSKDGDADAFAGLAWISERFGHSSEDREDAFVNYIKAQSAYERDGDLAFAQQVAEHRAMLSRLLPPEELSGLFISARRSIAASRLLARQ
ncbi:WD40 repeat protein [Bradyrhizobium sp. I1.8.5]